MDDISPTQLRALASCLILECARPKDLSEVAAILVALADAREGGMSLVDFAKTGEPRPCADVIPLPKRIARPVKPVTVQEAFERTKAEFPQTLDYLRSREAIDPDHPGAA